MKWSILILTLPSRTEFLNRLRSRLDPQLTGHNEIEVIVRASDPNMELGTNRQKLLETAHGEYVCFVDDDDLVAVDYISSILPLLDGVDYVGFRLQLYVDGQPDKPTIHSLRFREWGNGGFYARDISHLNPIRRELALMAHFEGGVGEDARWSNRLRDLGVVKTEHFIDRVMYDYLYRSQK